ncbi:MAG: NAD(P)H-hydrate dehydratase [Candidatus Nanopelagicaceae bacterium]|nr:NAD(P)H-hydrate dehydratase [Candidatus Nanopelagicaceae bacterium]
MPSKKNLFRRVPKSSDHKYSRGVVAVVAGSASYPGAAVLTVGGARRGGAGYVKFFAKSGELAKIVLQYFPDVVPIKNLIDEKIDSLVVGPGAVSLRSLPGPVPVVLDGAAMSLALNGKTKRMGRKDQNQIIVLTPHEGELQKIGYQIIHNSNERFTSLQIEKNRKVVAQRIAEELQVIVVLKGNRTVIAAPGKKPIIDSIGGPELATAGSGDILAGLIGAFLASWKPANLDAAQRVVADAVRLHSKAGKHAKKSHSTVVATDILESLAHC